MTIGRMGAAALGGAAAGVAAMALHARRERADGVERLERSAARFLNAHLVRALARTSLADDVPDIVATVEGPLAMFGHPYLLASPRGFEFRLWCGLNVNRIITCYFVRPSGAAAPDGFTQRLEAIFEHTFGGARRLGYEMSYEPVRCDEPGLHSIWTTVVVDGGLLHDPSRMLFWAQDVAMMTQCFIRTALRHDDEVSLDTRHHPRPL